MKEIVLYMNYLWSKIKNIISQVCILIAILCCLYMACAMVVMYWKVWIVIFVFIAIAVLTERK